MLHTTKYSAVTKSSARTVRPAAGVSMARWLPTAFAARASRQDPVWTRAPATWRAPPGPWFEAIVPPARQLSTHHRDVPPGARPPLRNSSIRAARARPSHEPSVPDHSSPQWPMPLNDRQAPRGRAPRTMRPARPLAGHEPIRRVQDARDRCHTAGVPVRNSADWTDQRPPTREETDRYPAQMP